MSCLKTAAHETDTAQRKREYQHFNNNRSTERTHSKCTNNQQQPYRHMHISTSLHWQIYTNLTYISHHITKPRQKFFGRLRPVRPWPLMVGDHIIWHTNTANIYCIVYALHKDSVWYTYKNIYVYFVLTFTFIYIYKIYKCVLNVWCVQYL